MLLIKCTPSIFLSSVYICPPPQKDICYVTVGVVKLETVITECNLFRI